MPFFKQLLLFTLFLVAVFNFFESNQLDIWVQNHFYNAASIATDHYARWIINKHNLVPEFLFHKLPKIIVIAAGIICLLLFLLSFRKERLCIYRWRALFVALCLLLVPLAISTIKRYTNTYCPNQLEMYGGNKPYVKVMEPYPKGFVQEKKGKCFPAGHATVGFSLMCLFFAFRERRHKIAGLAAGISAGWGMGIFQMLRGEHFLSHTIITMIVTWMVILVVHQIIYYARGRKPLTD